MRPLSNSNFVCDFFRYKESKYFAIMSNYLRTQQITLPSYDLQYEQLLKYYQITKVLHGYHKFDLSGQMSSTLNTKLLQPVIDTEDSLYKLCSFNYYKYRATNLMFGFNTNIMRQLNNFHEFNA